MDRALLEIVIVHWQEPWDVCRKIFQTLDIQRGMAREECRVTLVQDGEDGALDAGRLMRSYPFVTRVIRIPHGGVSAARNAGMDAAEAEWVMFCDCDDMFYSCDSLRTILDHLKKAAGADIAWGHAVTENRDATGRWYREDQGWNLVMLHGKCWRLDWLRECDLRFEERLAYSEDALFCGLAASETSWERIREIPGTVYMWCLRKGSCTADPERARRNRKHLALHRILKPQLFRQRGKETEAAANALRGIYESYYELTGGTIPEDEARRTEEKIWRELIVPWRKTCRGVSAEDKKRIMNICRTDAVRKGFFTTERILMQDWIRGLAERYGRDAE